MEEFDKPGATCWCLVNIFCLKITATSVTGGESGLSMETASLVFIRSEAVGTFSGHDNHYHIRPWLSAGQF